MNDSRDFQVVESVCSGQSHVSSQPVFFPYLFKSGGMQSRSLGMPSRNDGPPSIWHTWYTIAAKKITVLTHYRLVVLELI